MILQGIEQPSDIKVELEQYSTPASIAADVLWYAYYNGDIKEKVVLDAGCGTGIFAIGAALLEAKRVIGIDIDGKMIEGARKEAEKFHVDADFMVMDISDFEEHVDTVIMNPPFGAQFSNRGADKIFIKKAMEVGNKIYSLHLKKSSTFIKNMMEKEGWKIGRGKEYRFPIKASFPFNEKRVVDYDVELIYAFKMPL